MIIKGDGQNTDHGLRRWTTQTLTLIIFLGVVYFRVVHRSIPWTEVSILSITIIKWRAIIMKVS